MKLLVDMFACQTPSRFRGIGRYTLSLVSAMAKKRQGNEMAILADTLYPEAFEELRQIFIRLLPAGAFLPYYHEPLQNPAWQGTDSFSRIAETLIEHAYQVVEPDIVLTPSFFDGWGGGEHGMVPLPNKNFTNPFRAAILYDIIPYIFHEHYLDPDPPIRKWYLERIEMLRRFDLLLAISESTRQDAINHLGIDPDRVVNISGAASPQFRKLELSTVEKQDFLDRFGISRPFVLYVGGNDFRKNMDGALRAFACLPQQVRACHQLFLNDVGDEAVFRNKARILGLEDSDLVIARRTSDEELTTLYNLCKLFIFPSLYEGFGLPVLEAMSCGAPVLASNNSSLPEVVGRPDALFDVSSDQAVADKVCQVLTDDAFRAELTLFGMERAKQFSWENSARHAWDAIESLQKKKGSPKKQDIFFSARQRMRLAYVSPLPPQKSGISEYSKSLLPYLRSDFDIDLFIESHLEISDDFLKNNFITRPWTELPESSSDYEVVLYHMGNSEFHIPILRLLQDVPGVVVSHDFYVSNLPFVREMKYGEQGIFHKEMDYCHGLRGLVDWMKNGIESTRWAWPLNWKVLKYAQKMIVHSEHQRELIEEFYGYGWKPNIKVIKQLRESAPLISSSRKRALRKKLGLDPSAFIYCSFGFMAPTKLNNPTIKAFSLILSEVPDNTMLVFVGDLEGGPYGQETLKILDELKLNKKIRITGFVSNKVYENYLACADVAIQLRTDSRGETSRAVLDCMAYGLPVIMNAYGSLNDYDPIAVVKLPVIPSVEEIARAMIHLQADETFCKEKGQRARALIIEQHDPEKVAAEYTKVISTAAQTSEQKLFAPLVDSILELGSPTALQHSSAVYAAANLALRCQPRILVDVTGIERGLVEHDDQREITEIVKGLFSSDNKSIHVELVYENNENLWRAGRFAEILFELPGPCLESAIPIQPGDILLMNSHLLAKTAPAFKVFEQIRQNGGRIITMVNDTSGDLLGLPALESDMFLCGSQKCAKDVFDYLKVNPTSLTHPLDILFPCPEETTKGNDVDTINANFRMEVGQRHGLARIVKIHGPGQMEGCGWMQALMENGVIFTYGSDLVAGEEITKNENGNNAIVENQSLDQPEGQLEKVGNTKKTPPKRHYHVKIEGEKVPVVRCALSIPDAQGYSIVVQKDATDWISTSLIQKTFEVPGHYQMLFDLAHSNGNVLDLGAHIGTFSLMAGANGYHVTAVEASPRNAALLKESIRCNGFKNVHVVQAAISDRTGVMEFTQNGPYGMVSNAKKGVDKQTITVPSITVDDLIDQVNWQIVDMIKMDIEGSELYAIKGMSQLLINDEAPPILFESNGHTLHIFGITPGQLFSALEAYGYSCYHFFAGELFPIHGEDLQLECVADCIAAKRLPEDFMKRWKVAPAMSLESKLEIALGSLTHPNSDVRAYIGRTLKKADQSFLSDARINHALEELKRDANSAVHESVSWWPEKKNSSIKDQ